MKIKVILGSTRQGRVSEVIGKWVMEQAKNISGLDLELLDLRDYPMPFFDEAVSPSQITAPYTNETVTKWTAKIAEGEAFIIITPEYSHGYPAVLKNALDYVYKEWNGKKVAFVGYGGVGATRAIEQLRQVVIELQMIPLRNAVHVCNFWSLYNDKGELNLESFNSPLSTLLSQF